MKLETKHLAAYLPYEIEVKVDDTILPMPLIGLQQGMAMLIDPYGKDEIHNVELKHCKPLLKPLSLLSSENVNMGEIEFEIFKSKIKTLQAKYHNINLLIENAFDVFGLIDAGLAYPIDYFKDDRRNDDKYLSWLHELTTLGYDDEVMIPTEHGSFIRHQFDNGHTPEEALKIYKMWDKKTQNDNTKGN